MKLSQSGIGVTRLQNIDEVFPAQDILVQSGQIIQYGAGIYAYNNIPQKVKSNVEKIIKQVLDENGCIEVLLPTLQPEDMWQESGRWNNYVNDGTMLVVETRQRKVLLGTYSRRSNRKICKNKGKII